jgi:hypothetical protein
MAKLMIITLAAVLIAVGVTAAVVMTSSSSPSCESRGGHEVSTPVLVQRHLVEVDKCVGAR